MTVSDCTAIGIYLHCGLVEVRRCRVIHTGGASTNVVPAICGLVIFLFR